MNICVFGASADKLDPAYFAAAEELGALLHALGHRLIYGGGKAGLMGACARGVIRAGGRPLGIAPRFFDEPGINLFSHHSSTSLSERVNTFLALSSLFFSSIFFKMFLN